MRPCGLSAFLSLALTAQPLPLAEAEARYLDAWDLAAGPVAVPRVPARDRAALQWLVEAATRALPGNPFPKGSAPWREAEALRAFLRSKPERWSRELPALPLSLAGSRLALWRWGQLGVREGRLDRSLRLAWEDRLLERSGPMLVRESALRHAFCFALDAADSGRFGQLKERLEGDFPELFPRFQSAFALLGVPAPVVPLWSLPDLEPLQVSLGRLGSPHVRLEADPGKGLPALPPDTVWVVPTRDGSQPATAATLEGESLAEAKSLAPRLAAAGRKAYLAPVRSAFEAYALMYFPIQLELDFTGAITRIRMGDAALAQPRPAP